MYKNVTILVLAMMCLWLQLRAVEAESELATAKIQCSAQTRQLLRAVNNYLPAYNSYLGGRTHGR